MKFFKDFKKFISRGNLIDLAVGIMIGGAFNSIVKSFVDDILTPFISVFLGKTKMDSWKFEFKLPIISDGVPPDVVLLSYGKFLQSCIDFTILAFIIFIIVKIFNSILDQANDPKNKEVPTPRDIELLSEMSDSLKGIQTQLENKS